MVRWEMHLFRTTVGIKQVAQSVAGAGGAVPRGSQADLNSPHPIPVEKIVLLPWIPG